MPAAKPRKQQALAGRVIRASHQTIAHHKGTGIVKARSGASLGDPAKMSMHPKFKRPVTNGLRGALRQR